MARVEKDEEAAKLAEAERKRKLVSIESERRVEVLRKRGKR